MRVAAPLFPALLALALAACGGDDETTSSTMGASETSGAQGATGGSSELTASEFIAASIPDQIDAVQQAVDDNPACDGVDAAPGGDFQVGVAIDAASANPDTPISQIVADSC